MHMCIQYRIKVEEGYLTVTINRTHGLVMIDGERVLGVGEEKETEKE